MNITKQTRLIRFLTEELSVSHESVAIAQRHPDYSIHLPMVLWQYGLITLDQLDQIFEWLEAA